MSIFSNRLRTLMKQRNYSQRDLAVRAGLTQAAVCHYVSGNRVPRATTMCRIADALEVSVMDLVGNEEVSEEQLLAATRLVVCNAGGLNDRQKMDLLTALVGIGA